MVNEDFPGGTVVKNLPANAGDARDTGLFPGLGRSPGVGNALGSKALCCPESWFLIVKLMCAHVQNWETQKP